MTPEEIKEYLQASPNLYKGIELALKHDVKQLLVFLLDLSQIEIDLLRLSVEEVIKRDVKAALILNEALITHLIYQAVKKDDSKTLSDIFESTMEIREGFRNAVLSARFNFFL